MKIKILASASRDLIEGYRFYEMQAKGVGANFLDSLFEEKQASERVVGPLLVVVADPTGADAPHLGQLRTGLIQTRAPFPHDS